MLPPLSFQRRPGQFYGRTRDAQRSQALCKGGITRTTGLPVWRSEAEPAPPRSLTEASSGSPTQGAG